MEHVGELVRYHRGRVGMTQEQLAQEAGISTAALVRLEGGEIKRPRAGTLSKLAGALGVDPAELVGFVARPGHPAVHPAVRPESVEVSGVGPFTAVFQRDEGWWIGYVEELPGANAQERTLEEVRDSLREAVSDVLEANRELTRTEFEGLAEVVREPLRA